MIYIGMIFQFDSSEGTGLMMFAEGDKRAFTSSEWVDGENTPTVGQKVSYEISGDTVRIKVAGGSDTITAVPPEVKQSTQEETTTFTESFSSMEECAAHYTDMGFKLVKNLQGNALETITLRKLEMGEPIEVIVTQNGSSISVAKTVNGKPA